MLLVVHSTADFAKRIHMPLGTVVGRRMYIDIPTAYIYTVGISGGEAYVQRYAYGIYVCRWEKWWSGVADGRPASSCLSFASNFFLTVDGTGRRRDGVAGGALDSGLRKAYIYAVGDSGGQP